MEKFFFVLIRMISAIAEALRAERERERERVVKLATCTLFTAAQCQTAVCTYKLLHITGSLLEFEFTLRNCFHFRLSNSALYELLCSLSVSVQPTLAFKIFLHNITYKSFT